MAALIRLNGMWCVFYCIFSKYAVLSVPSILQVIVSLGRCMEVSMQTAGIFIGLPLPDWDVNLAWMCLQINAKVKKIKSTQLSSQPTTVTPKAKNKGSTGWQASNKTALSPFARTLTKGTQLICCLAPGPVGAWLDYYVNAKASCPHPLSQLALLSLGSALLWQRSNMLPDWKGKRLSIKKRERGHADKHMIKAPLCADTSESRTDSVFSVDSG